MVKKLSKGERSQLKLRHEEDLEKEKDLIEQEKIAAEIEDNEEVEEAESVNFVDEINEKLESIKNDFEHWYQNKPNINKWLERPFNVSSAPLPEYLNPDDDIKRELLFYNIAKENAIKSIINLKNLGEKLNRPDDYFVEMLKSDEQMMRVKKQIINQQQHIKRFEAKKQKEQNIKFARRMKDFENKQKSKFKRDTYEGVEKWKQHIKNNPNDYNKIDKFFKSKREKFSGNNSKKPKIKEPFKKRKAMKRPGKNNRIMMKNKKNSKK